MDDVINNIAPIADETLTTITPLVIDLIVLIVILLVGLIYLKKGLYNTAMTLIVIVLAIVIGLVVSKMTYQSVSDKIWDKYGATVEAEFDTKVEAKKNDEFNLGSELQDSLYDLIESFGDENLSNIFADPTKNIDYNDSKLVQELKLYTLVRSKLILTNIVRIAIFGLTTAILLLILTFIKNTIGELAELPIINIVNRLGGFLVGAVGTLIVFIFVSRFLGSIGFTFLTDLSEGTVLLKWITNCDTQETINFIKNVTIDDLKTIDFSSVLKEYNIEETANGIYESLNGIDLQEVIKNFK